MRRTTLACLIGFVALPVVAFATERDIDVGLDISAEREHQVFSDSSANLDTVSIQPYLLIDNWSFTLDLPWQRAQGERFVNNNYPPQLLDGCATLAGLTTPQRQTLASRRPRLLSYLDSECAAIPAANDDVSGLGDVTAFAYYGLPLDAQGVWVGALGVGYKADNGEARDGLGSGTQDVKIEGSLSATAGRLTGTLVLGYDRVIGGDYEEFFDDFIYAAVDVSMQTTSWLTVGAGWDFEQAYIEDLDNVQSLSAHVGVKPFESLRLRLYYKDYLDIEGYPDHSIGGGVTYSF